MVLAAHGIVSVPAERALAARPGAHVEPAVMVVAVVAVLVVACAHSMGGREGGWG